GLQGKELEISTICKTCHWCMIRTYKCLEISGVIVNIAADPSEIWLWGWLWDFCIEIVTVYCIFPFVTKFFTST
ncbi:MAG: hypothetical protein QF535_14965, partial [Anaerolineales bacterium]|nr:hypothetical protein [Anaerolineales bacterium]